MSADQDDRQRDVVLATYGVVGGPARRELQALVELAAQVAGASFATINIFGTEVQYQVATTGFEGKESPAEVSMCWSVVQSGRALMVEDATHEEQFDGNPWTTGELANIRYYGSHPLRTPAGVVIGTLCVFDDDSQPVTAEAAKGLAQLADRVVDVLELELASRRLSETNTRLSASNERLARFAGQVSHDLKNPLTAVSLLLESLELDVTEPDQLNTVARARRGVDRMSGLIDNLLDFASQGQAPGDAIVDLSQELSHALDDLSGHVDRASIRTGELPMVRGDSAQLRSVLMNLVDNAVKFSGDGEPPEIEIDAHPLDGRHRIEVRDRGRGVPSDQREWVFAPLARLDKTVEGVGIGLATCRRIVQGHAGTIGVEERDGGGSVFWFELPAADDVLG